MTEPDAFALLFYVEHRQCGQLQQAVDDRPGGRIVLTCSCGATMMRLVDAPRTTLRHELEEVSRLGTASYIAS
jgi:hypothetical protein